MNVAVADVTGQGANASPSGNAQIDSNVSKLQQATPAQTSGPTHQTSGKDGPDPTGLRSSLRKAITETNAAKEAKATAGQTHGEAALATGDAAKDTAAAGSKDGGVSRETDRDESGKFKSRADTGTQTPPRDEPPSSWRTEAKALWKDLDTKLGPDAARILKEELTKREGDFLNGITAKDKELGAVKPLYDELQTLFKPHLQDWTAQGVSPQQAVSHLLNLGASFRRNPAGTIQWLANAARIDLAALAASGAQQGQAHQQGGATADPQWQPVFTGLNSRLQQLESGLAEREVNAAASEIQALIDEKGADGQPVRPYFNDVFADMKLLGPLIQAQHPGWSPRQIAAESYERAVWANKDVRQKMNDAAAAKAKADAESAERQQRAANAAKSVSGSSPNNLNPGLDPGNLRGTLQHHANRVNGGGAARL